MDQSDPVPHDHRAPKAPPASDLPLVVPMDSGGAQVPPILSGLGADLGANHSYGDGLYFGGWFAPPGGQSPPPPPLKWLGQFHERLGALANRASQGGGMVRQSLTVRTNAQATSGSSTAQMPQSDHKSGPRRPL